MKHKTMAALVAMVSLSGLALLYFSINNSSLSDTSETSGGEGLAVSISNVKKDLSEYTLMKDYNGGKATRVCGSQITVTFTLTDTGDKDTAVNVSLTVRGEQIQTQKYALKAGEQINGSLQGSYPKCSLNKDEIDLKTSN
ncbi:MAG: hypothetical protein M1503_00770 [Thaumarchaeota archaeon]|nr:hypothetical protein [Nitrososphaerota archaeon]MCL5316786.1 hypothetical protein [Nitrososphaerota archaeon]